ncbi:MAG TPA: glycosyltransferase [Rhabdochlamydiaceae bacterium]|nr:glycosyltransferase [Rhabdochlamydiaceae bacterium]
MSILKGYEFKIIYPLNEVRLLGVKSGESIYNSVIYNNYNRLMNVMARAIFPKVLQMQRRGFESYISKNIEEFNPDLVVSIMPFINLPATEAARKMELPFLLITIDNDLENWVLGFESLQHSNFKITIGSDLPSTTGILEKYSIEKENIAMIGLPLRPDFQAKKTKAELRQEYGVSAGRSVILLMMGGAGAKRCMQYAKKIAKMDLKTHLFVCLGKNAGLAPKLNGIWVHPGNALTVIPFTEKIHDLMTLSDLLVTKPGPGTINEAIETKTPVLLDEIGGVLFWEKINIDLALMRGIGNRVRSFSELEAHLKDLLFNYDSYQQYQTALKKIPPNGFIQNIQPLIDSLCQEEKDFVKIK